MVGNHPDFTELCYDAIREIQKAVLKNSLLTESQD